MSEKKSNRKAGTSGKPDESGRSDELGAPGHSAGLEPGSPAASATSAGQSGGPMDVGLLAQIVKLMYANDLTTVEVADGDKRILLQRGGVAGPVPAGYPSATIPPAASLPAPAAASADIDANLLPIKSIMVGTFYAASGPDAKPFVSVGSHVEEDTDVCVIEAMKVFNTIKAECRGTIAKVLVTNGQAVEFGQALFLVRQG